MNIKTKFNIGDPAFIKHDPEQHEYEIVAIIARPGSIMLELSFLGEVIEMYDFQVSDTKDEMKKLGLTEKEID